jgi:hypothetical protein
MCWWLQEGWNKFFMRGAETLVMPSLLLTSSVALIFLAATAGEMISSCHQLHGILSCCIKCICISICPASELPDVRHYIVLSTMMPPSWLMRRCCAGGPAWQGYFKLLDESRLVHVTTIDAALCCALLPFWMNVDAEARGWKQR